VGKKKNHSENPFNLKHTHTYEEFRCKSL